MKKRFLPFVFLMVALATLGCDQDPCEVDHVMVDGECIPDYIFPQNQNPRTGDRYYHAKYGIIIYKDSVWVDAQNQFIETNAH